MKSIVIIILFNLFSIGIFGQTWEITPKISYDRFIMLEGQIDSTYNITMYLDINGGLCGFEDYANQWRNRTISGWYYYNNIKAKIPLVGYFNWGDSFEWRNKRENTEYHRVELFVPQNYLEDTLIQNNCKIKGYSEKFYSDEFRYDFESLIWTNHLTELPVNMKTIHEKKLETKAEFIVTMDGLEMGIINVSELSKLNYIEGLELVDSKEVDGYIHLTMSFNERTNPGGSGGGYCGAGVEAFLGYAKLRKNWTVEIFEFKQVHSCINWDKVENYKIEQGKPELGLIKGDE